MLIFRVLAVVFCLIGVFWLAWLQVENSHPRVCAEVLEAAVTQTNRGQYQGSFIFRYEFGGRTFEGRLDTPVQTSSIRLAQREVDELPVGAVIELPIRVEQPDRLNWPPFGKGGRLVGPLAFLVLGFCFWAIPEGVVVLVDRKVSPARAVYYCMGPLGLLMLGLAVACLSSPYKIWKEWPATLARIERSESAGSGKNRSLRLECRYQVEGKETLGVLYSAWTVSRQQVDSWLLKYPPGKELRIRYYPKNPTICREDLNWSSFSVSLGLALSGLVFCSLALLCRRFLR